MDGPAVEHLGGVEVVVLEHLQSAVSAVAAPWFDVLDQRSLLSYVAGGWFVVVSASIARLLRGQRIRVRAIARLIFQRKVWLHPSALLDYRLYLVNLVLMALLPGAYLIGSQAIADAVTSALKELTGSAGGAVVSSWPVLIATALALLLAMDLGYWVCHFAMHKSAALWEIHKVHHSAEVMTPATEFREHPIEILLSTNTQALLVGVVYGVAIFLLGRPTAQYAAALYGVVLIAHLLSFHHMRHSHLSLAFTGVLGRILHSPSHHLLHHSDNPAHFDRNLGYMLSIWDWMAGTLIIPKRGQRISLGIGPEGADHATVGKALWQPMRNCAARLASAARLKSSSGQTIGETGY